MILNDNSPFSAQHTGKYFLFSQFNCLCEKVGLSPEQAAETAKNYIQQAEPDGAYSRASHPDHRRSVERIQRLYTQAHAEDDPGVQFDSHGEELPERLSPESQQMAKEAFEEQAEMVDKTRAAMQEDMDFLVEHGFNRTEFPDELEPYKVNALRMQRLFVEGNKAAILPLLQKELTQLRAGPDIQSLFSSMVATGSLDEGLQKEFFDRLLVWIYESRETQAEELKNATGYSNTARKEE